MVLLKRKHNRLCLLLCDGGDQRSRQQHCTGGIPELFHSLLLAGLKNLSSIPTDLSPRVENPASSSGRGDWAKACVCRAASHSAAPGQGCPKSCLLCCSQSCAGCLIWAVSAGQSGHPAAPGQGCPKLHLPCCIQPCTGYLIWAVSAGHSGHPAAPGARSDHAVCGAPPVNGGQMRPGAQPFPHC